jgi:hypothetical protein
MGGRGKRALVREVKESPLVEAIARKWLVETVID